MDGMLSQDEINALLNGMDVGSDSGADSGSSDAGSDAAPEGGGSKVGDVELSAMECDAIGEVANISMGSSATTLYSLVNRKVNITTPTVTLATWESVIQDYEKPCVFIQIKYTVGLDGSNILVLKEHDVLVIADLMMGGDGNVEDTELNELHLSAISEAMNQMMGASATSLSTMLGKMIDISPPEASQVDFTEGKQGSEIAEFLGGTFAKISFRMQIDDLVDSTIMQLYPLDFARDLCNVFLASQSPEPEPAPAPEPVAPSAPVTPVAPPPAAPAPGPGPQAAPDPMMAGYAQPMPQMYAQPMPQMYAQPMAPTNVMPAQFQNLAPNMAGIPGGENIGIIMDVPLEVTVELGRTSKSISEILDFAPGTILELDKIAGEPVDVLVNGKFVAKGEVVVIEESFGVRVTEIINQ
ncbi:MAG: flagellar motor switch phosphatase FliY [Lachnospiraceae bacterium]|nr:flagellar motor switch phosphatase FliY [Lachnospiraceae bacterium]